MPIITSTLTFDKLPEAVAYLAELVKDLRGEMRELRNAIVPSKNEETPYITSKEACELLGECKNTLYEKARNGTIPAYKNPGSKAWRFVKSELLEYLASGKRKSQTEVYDEMVAEMSKGLRPGGRNKMCRL